jgi:beta-lactamase regulating signal transducer with metallopeptidase domain
MSILLYFLKAILCSGILFGYYHLFLRNKRFHHYNRFYLLGTLVLSLVLPLFKIPVFNEDSGTLNQVVYRTAKVITVSPAISAVSPVQEASTLFTPGNLVWVVYGVGILVVLVMLARSLGYIRKISQRYPFERINDLKFYQTQEPGTPFSFFRSIFWNDALNFNSQQGQQIFRHELFHVQQKHSIDILLAEIITMLSWFNPFFYLIKKELKAIHEFLADQYAASGSNRYQYAELLVEQVMASRAASLAHPFFQHQLKRRITMITQLNQTKYGYWSRVMVLPLSVRH